MRKSGRRLFPGLFLGSLMAATLGPLALGCSNENLGTSGAGGKTGAASNTGGGGNTRSTVGSGGVAGAGGFITGAAGTRGAAGMRGAAAAGGAGGLTVGLGGAAGGLSGGTGGIGGATGGSGGATGGYMGTGGCDSFSEVPPILTLVDSTTGGLICAASFTIVAVSDGGIIPNDPTGGAYSCEGTERSACPFTPLLVDGGGSCRFVLGDLAGAPATSEYTVEITAPGYEPAEALDVVGGKSGCYGAWPASKLTIDLTPNKDGGTADGSVDAGPLIGASDSPLHL
jgi:hypothetical protein